MSASGKVGDNRGTGGGGVTIIYLTLSVVSVCLLICLVVHHLKQCYVSVAWPSPSATEVVQKPHIPRRVSCVV